MGGTMASAGMASGMASALRCLTPTLPLAAPWPPLYICCYIYITMASAVFSAAETEACSPNLAARSSRLVLGVGVGVGVGDGG